jgi:protein-S-isoprenylcysteine O-methyltransferase Ste14
LNASDLIPLARPSTGNAWILMAYHFLPMPIMWITGIGSARRGLPKITLRNAGPWIPWIALYALSIFTPLRTDSSLTGAGLVIAFIGLALYTPVIFSFLRSGGGERIITGGLYRYSRHPMYVTQAIFLAGMCFATQSLPFLILSLCVTISPFRNAKKEEIHCLSMHGDAYRRYMDRTPMWIGRPREDGREGKP